jgi:hypothetical protein
MGSENGRILSCNIEQANRIAILERLCHVSDNDYITHSGRLLIAMKHGKTELKNLSKDSLLHRDDEKGLGYRQL